MLVNCPIKNFIYLIPLFFLKQLNYLNYLKAPFCTPYVRRFIRNFHNKRFNRLLFDR